MSTYVPSIKRSKIDDVSQVQQSSYITATKRHLNFPTEVLLKILEWLDRNCLEKFQQICKLLNGLVVKHFPNKPYHPLYPIYPDQVELNIHPSSTAKVLDISILIYPSFSYFDPKTRAWKREYTDSSLEEMLPYLASSSVRIKHTKIYGGDAPFTNNQIAAIESVAHVWDGQELSMSRLSRTDSEILLSPFFIRCQQLEIGDMDNIPLYNNPVLYKMPVLKCLIPKNAKQLFHWIEHKPDHPESCTALVLDNAMYSLVPNEDTLFYSEIPKFIQKVKKKFLQQRSDNSQSTNSFKVVIIRAEDSSHLGDTFSIDNRHSSETLSFKCLTYERAIEEYGADYVITSNDTPSYFILERRRT